MSPELAVKESLDTRFANALRGTQWKAEVYRRAAEEGLTIQITSRVAIRTLEEAVALVKQLDLTPSSPNDRKEAEMFRNLKESINFILKGN